MKNCTKNQLQIFTHTKNLNEILPDVCRLAAQLIVTIPASSVLTERLFSAFLCIETNLHNIHGQERLSPIALNSLECWLKCEVKLCCKNYITHAFVLILYYTHIWLHNYILYISVYISFVYFIFILLHQI